MMMMVGSTTTKYMGFQCCVVIPHRGRLTPYHRSCSGTQRLTPLRPDNMSRLQPVGQKKLTNICVVRYKRSGKRFEVAAYRNTVLAWRNGNQTDLDEVLQAHTIFSNLEKGDIAKSEDLIEAFGTDNEDVVCVEVLNKARGAGAARASAASLAHLPSDLHMCRRACESSASSRAGRAGAPRASGAVFASLARSLH